MKRKSPVTLGLILLLASVVAAGQEAPAKVKAIEKRGKVEAAAKGGCLLLRDAGDHKLYNVFFGAVVKPKAGDEISFTGTLHPGPTTCTQAIAVDVTSWKLIKAAGPEPVPLEAT